MRQSSIRNSLTRGLFLLATIFTFSAAAHAQDIVKAEGKTSYLFNPVTGETKLSFTRLSNYSYSPKTVHVALALTAKPYTGGSFKPNFSKKIGDLPARTYSNPFTVSGFGSYPKSGSFYVTVGIGVTNAQGGVTLVHFLSGKKVAFGKKGKKAAKRARIHKQLDGFTGNLVSFIPHSAEIR